MWQRVDAYLAFFLGLKHVHGGTQSARSESLITFDQTDHSNCVLKPRRFPLILDPLVGTTWLMKALMDGGSHLKLMYLDTFEGLGLAWDQLKTSPHPLYRVVPGK
jgi:hypothetical protein